MITRHKHTLLIRSFKKNLSSNDKFRDYFYLYHHSFDNIVAQTRQMLLLNRCI